MNEGVLPGPRKRPWPRVWLAVAMGLVLVGGAVAIAGPSLMPGGIASPGGAASSPTGQPSLPGGPGHFDDGTFAFDYPTNWRVASGEFLESPATQIYAVLGTGVWRSGCNYSGSGGSCTGDVVDVSGGRVVVKLWARVGGPVAICTNMPATTAFGPNEVQQSSQDGAVTWEIRRPGAQFGVEMNVFAQVWADGPAALASAQDLVRGFTWDSGVGAGGECYPMSS